MSRHTARQLDAGSYVIEDAQGRYVALIPPAVAGACQLAQLFAAATDMRHTLSRIAAGQCADPEADALAALRRCLTSDPPAVPFRRPAPSPDGAA